MKQTKHSVKVYLYQSTLTDGANDYVARVSAEKSLSISEICNNAEARGGSDISAAAMEHAVRNFLKEMGYQLSDGFSVNAEYFTATPQIKGLFKGPTDTFDPNRHTISFLFNQGAAMRSLLPDMSIDVVGVAETGINIAEVIDVKSGSINQLLTPNRNLRIKGSKLKIAGDEQAVGIFFTKIASKERFKVEANDIVTNNPSELIIVVPQLPSGIYSLEIVSQYGGTNLIKEPRTATFDSELIVR